MIFNEWNGRKISNCIEFNNYWKVNFKIPPYDNKLQSYSQTQKFRYKPADYNVTGNTENGTYSVLPHIAPENLRGQIILKTLTSITSISWCEPWW